MLQDIATSLSDKSSKFSSYSTDQVETFEKQIPKMCFPVEDMGFDNFDGSFGGVVRGKRAYDINEDYNINRYNGNLMVLHLFKDEKQLMILDPIFSLVFMYKYYEAFLNYNVGMNIIELFLIQQRIQMSVLTTSLIMDYVICLGSMDQSEII